jgi:ketosteroid isomerase-like protein
MRHKSAEEGRNEKVPRTSKVNRLTRKKKRGIVRATVNVEAEKAAIKSVLDNYVTSVEKADMGLYAKTVAHDPGMVNFGTAASERIVGWDALREVMEAQNAALSGTKIAASDVTVNVSSEGRFAWATSLWEFKATMGGQAIALPVRCTWILEKRETGWVVVHFHKSVGTA